MSLVKCFGLCFGISLFLLSQSSMADTDNMGIQEKEVPETTLLKEPVKKADSKVKLKTKAKKAKKAAAKSSQ